MASLSRFHWADYIVFAAVILLSCVVGIYYAIQDKRSKRNTVEDFLLAGRSMSVLPVSVSMFVSWLSAISFLGDPVEVYQQGSIYWIIGIGYCLGLPLVAELFGPKYHDLKLLSIFEFLEQRYHKSIRVIASVLNGFGGAIYTGIVLYAPALALAQVTGISPWTSTLAIGSLCIIYTSMGGMKAVLWVDTVQVGIMFMGILILLVRGVLVMGGISNVWNMAQESHRINFNKFDPSPTARSTFWAYLIGGFFRTFNPYISGQMEVQRYLSLRTKRQVKLALYMNIPLYALFVTMFALIGLMMVAYFKDCDPLLEGRIEKVDQMLPLMMMELLGHMHGLPGLFLACLFCASLSSMSSVQNSLATIMLKDSFEPLHKFITGKTLTASQSLLLAKIFSVFAGGLSIALAIVVMNLKDASVFQICLKATGATLGPISSLFVLGTYVPLVSTAHALIGVSVSTTICMWLLIGPMLVDVKPTAILPLTTAGCDVNNTYMMSGNQSSQYFYADGFNETLSDEQGYSGLSQFYQITPLLYNAIGSIITLVVAIVCALISRLFCGKPAEVKPNIDVYLSEKSHSKRLDCDDVGSDDLGIDDLGTDDLNERQRMKESSMY